MKYLSLCISCIILQACTAPVHQYAKFNPNRRLTGSQIVQIETGLNAILSDYNFSSDIWNLNAGIKHSKANTEVAYFGYVANSRPRNTGYQKGLVCIFMYRDTGHISLSEHVGGAREMSPAVLSLCQRIMLMLDRITGRGTYRIEFKTERWHLL